MAAGTSTAAVRDENNITVDGATAVRTRSNGAIVGVQNVDTIQEVQVLTGSYMPEYGRASGGQVRLVTKSGSNRFSGSAGYYHRDDKLQANTWARNRSTNAIENSGAAPFDFKQYGYSIGGPILKNRLFFFGAQEWANQDATQTAVITVPTMAMRNGDFSELLNPNNGFFTGARVINDPLTGQPFPGNIIPASRLSHNGTALMELYPEPTAGFRQGTNNAIINSENPQEQRKDNIRFDWRPSANHQFSYRFSKSNYIAIDAFRDNLPFARTDWDRPNFTTTASWTSTFKSNLVNELTFTAGRDDVFINVFTESGLHQRSRTDVNYPYIFAEKEIVDKIPTVTGAGFQTIDGGPYPASSQGPITTVTNTTTWLKGRHTFKAGVSFEYSGEDDFDQINVNAIPGSTNNQNGRFEFSDTRTGGTGTAMSNMAMGLFTNYAELGQRNFTKWRALATDVFLQDSWRPTAKLTVEGGVRYVYWPPWYSTTNNIASFNEAAYNPSNAPTVNPANGQLSGGVRYNGVILPGDGFEGEGHDSVVADDPAVLALFGGHPRGLSETHGNVFEPRLGASYQLNEKTVIRASGGIFHNRVPLNDSTLLGGNPPFQPQATVSNGSVDNPGGVGVNPGNLPIGITGQDPVFKHPTSYLWSTGVQREVPGGFIIDMTYVGRRGLYLQRERNINQLPLGTVNNPANAGDQHRRAASLPGLRPDPPVGERRRVHVQQPADLGRPPLHQRSEGRRGVHAGQVDRQRLRQAQRAVEHCRRHVVLRTVELRSPARVQLLLHLRPAVLPRPERVADCQPPRRLADFGRDVHALGDAVHRHAERTGHRGRGRRERRPALEREQPRRHQLPVVQRHAGIGGDGHQRVRASGQQHVRQLAAQLVLQPGRAAVGPGAVQELQPFWHASPATARRVLQLHQPPEPGRHRVEPAERQLWSHHVQGRQPSRRAAERAVHVLALKRGAFSDGGPRDRPPRRSSRSLQAAACRLPEGGATIVASPFFRFHACRLAIHSGTSMVPQHPRPWRLGRSRPDRSGSDRGSRAATRLSGSYLAIVSLLSLGAAVTRGAAGTQGRSRGCVHRDHSWQHGLVRHGRRPWRHLHDGESRE